MLEFPSMDTITIGEAFDTQLGKMLSSEAKSASKKYPYITNRNVRWGRLDLSGLGEMGFTTADRQRLTLLPQDLVVCEGGEIGRCAMWLDDKFTCYFQNSIHRMRTIRPDIYPLFYLYVMEYLGKHDVFFRLAGQTSIAHLTQDSLRSVVIPHPDIDTQIYVANVLSSVDTMILDTESCIDKLTQFKRGILYDLMTYGVDENGKIRDPLSNPEIFVNSDLGQLPREWKIRSLADVSVVKPSNVDKKTDPSERPILLCNYMDVYSNDFIDDSLEFMQASATRQEIQTFELKSGDVIITKDSETPYDIAVPAVVPTELSDMIVCGYHLTLIRPIHDVILGEFLAMALQTRIVNSHFVRSANGSTRYGITLSATEEALIPVPPLEEQRRIVEAYNLSNSRLNDEVNQLMDLEKMRDGLMDDLLSGRVRVPEFVGVNV